MNFRFLSFFILLAVLACAAPCQAISEINYASNYRDSVAPFLKSGQSFSFPSANTRNGRKYALQGIKFIHPRAKGMIVVINGFSQSYLQYGELFYDLYNQGYSIISYDHRGQGLSPHLVPANSQIGTIERFSDYTADLNSFMERVVEPLHPNSKNLFLIANSMGGAIATDYLEQHSSPPPFEKIVLSAPMFRINTSPYPEWLGHLIVGALQGAGLGRHYAPGEHDFDSRDSFANNRVTHSFPRWQIDHHFKTEYPKARIAGASNSWVNTSLSATQKIRKDASSIPIPTLILQAGKDQLVMNQAESEAALRIPHSKLLSFPDAKHGILMEKDSIRSRALREIKRFFEGK